MQFGNAIWLWGLAGLIIPIGIHLLSRKAGSIIKFGSVRHLEDTSTRQFKSIRLNELLLLALRCLFIILLVFLLARLHFNQRQKNEWVLIEPGLQYEPRYALFLDSLKRSGFEIKALTPGFPDPDDADAGKVDYWSLVNDMSAASQVIVISYNYIEGFKGKRIGLPDHVRWLSGEPDSIRYALEAFELAGDSVALRIGKSDPKRTSYRSYNTVKSQSDSLQIENADTISVAVVFDRSHKHDKDIVVAGLAAVDKASPHKIIVEAMQMEDFPSAIEHTWMIWLSQKSPPVYNKNFIRLEEKFISHELFWQMPSSGSNEAWLLTQRLNEEVALHANLPVQLALILLPAGIDRDRIRSRDKRVLPDKLRWSTDSKNSTSVPAAADTRWSEKILMIALLVILFFERVLALKRNQ